MSNKPRFRFLHEAGGFLYWESVLPVSPGDSRHVQVWMDAGRYLGRERTIHGSCENEGWDHDPHFWGDDFKFYCNGDMGVGLRRPA